MIAMGARQERSREKLRADRGFMRWRMARHTFARASHSLLGLGESKQGRILGWGEI